MAATKSISVRVSYHKFAEIAEYCNANGIKDITEFLLLAIDLKLKDGQPKQPSQMATTTLAKEDVIPTSEPITPPKPTPQQVSAAPTSELVATPKPLPQPVSAAPTSKPEPVQNTYMMHTHEQEEELATQFARWHKRDLIKENFLKKIEPFFKYTAAITKTAGVTFFSQNIFLKEINEAVVKIEAAEDPEKAIEEEYEAFIKIAKERFETIKTDMENKRKKPKSSWWRK